MNVIKEDSIKKKFLYKFFTLIFSFISNILVLKILPNTLGVKLYGDLKYLQDFFIKLTRFINSFSSSFFYNNLSREYNKKRVLVFYFKFIMCCIFILVFIFLIITIGDLYPYVWPEQQLNYIVIAAIWGISLLISEIMFKVMDAYGLSVIASKIRLLLRLSFTLLLLVLLYFDIISISIFLVYEITLLSIISVSLIFQLKKNKHLVGISSFSSNSGRLWKKFKSFSHPLLTLSALLFLGGIFERWLLQLFSGSFEQGYFSIAQRIGIICSMFTTSLSPLVIREFSVAFGKSNKLEMKSLFEKFIPILYILSIFIGSFVAMNSEVFINVFVGGEFASAKVPLIIMAFYPAHQTYGQLSGSFLVTIERTKLYRNIGLLTLIIGTALSYFLLAPNNMGGLNAGALGLAVSLVLTQIISVNIQLYFNVKYLNISFLKYIFHQIYSILIFVCFAFIAKIIISFFPLNNLIYILFSGLFYTVISVLFILLFPRIFFIDKKMIDKLLKKISKRIKGGKSV